VRPSTPGARRLRHAGGDPGRRSPTAIACWPMSCGVLGRGRASGVCGTVFLRHYSMPTELAGVFQLRQAKGRGQAQGARVGDAPADPARLARVRADARARAARASEAVIDKITMSAFEGDAAGHRAARLRRAGVPDRRRRARSRDRADGSPFGGISATSRSSSTTRAEPATPRAGERALDALKVRRRRHRRRHRCGDRPR